MDPASTTVYYYILPYTYYVVCIFLDSFFLISRIYNVPGNKESFLINKLGHHAFTSRIALCRNIQSCTNIYLYSAIAVMATVPKAQRAALGIFTNPAALVTFNVARYDDGS